MKRNKEKTSRNKKLFINLKPYITLLLFLLRTLSSKLKLLTNSIQKQRIKLSKICIKDVTKKERNREKNFKNFKKQKTFHQLKTLHYLTLLLILRTLSSKLKLLKNEKTTNLFSFHPFPKVKGSFQGSLQKEPPSLLATLSRTCRCGRNTRPSHVLSSRAFNKMISYNHWIEFDNTGHKTMFFALLIH